MRRLTIILTALLLTLALAVPAAANQKVLVPFFTGEVKFEVPVDLSDPDWPTMFADWQCSGPLIFGVDGWQDAWFWYPRDVDVDDPDALYPADAAWPWIKGELKGQGIDYFVRPDGMMLAGHIRVTNHLKDHHLGSRVDPTDPETWIEMTTGTQFGLHVPGHGTVIHWAGNDTWQATMRYDPEWGWYSDYQLFRDFRGNWTIDAEELCGYFGYTVVRPPAP